MSFNQISMEKEFPFLLLDLRLRNEDTHTLTIKGLLWSPNESQRMSLNGGRLTQKGAEMTSSIEKVVQWRPKRTRDWLWIST